MKHLLSIAVFMMTVVFAIAQPESFRKSVGGVEFCFTIIDDDKVAVSLCHDRQFLTGASKTVRAVPAYFSIPEEVQRDGNKYSVTRIEDSAFVGCTGLLSVSIPLSVNSIGMGVFDGCTSLRTLTLYCDSLDMSTIEAFTRIYFDTIVIASTVRSLPSFLFSEQKKLKYIDFRAEHPYRMSGLFFSCPSNAVLHVASSVEAIPDNIFYYFSGLQRVVFDADSRLRAIGDMAFSNCGHLEDIVFPSLTERVGDGAFSYCQPLQIHFLGKQPPFLATTSFLAVNKQIQVFIPCHTLGLYARSSVGNLFPNLVYADGCVSSSAETEVIYVRDTVYIHDTIYLSVDFFSSTTDVDSSDDSNDTTDISQDEAESSNPYLHIFTIEGQYLIIKEATSRRGVSVRIFDEKGKLVIDQRIPRSQMTDSYRVRLPERRRYYLRLDMGKPYLIDVPSQKVKE